MGEAEVLATVVFVVFFAETDLVGLLVARPVLVVIVCGGGGNDLGEYVSAVTRFAVSIVVACVVAGVEVVILVDGLVTRGVEVGDDAVVSGVIADVTGSSDVSERFSLNDQLPSIRRSQVLSLAAVG